MAEKEKSSKASGKVSGEAKEEVKVEKAASFEQVAAAVEVSRDARTWGMWCHLAGLAWMLVWIVPIIGGVVGALVVWQIKRDDDPFIDEQGREALNFQISMLIYWAVSMALIFACIGLVLVPVVAVLDVVFALVAAVKAGQGQLYRYPMSIRFIK
jgi:uncharacterized Tic20 family protein